MPVEEKSCGVVVFRQDPGARVYLLLHYEEGHWDFPKGHVEKGESEVQTALRELAEETGIRESGIRLVPGFRERIEYSYTYKGRHMHKEVFFFLGSATSADIRISREHIGFVWLPYGKALGRLTFENARAVLEKAKKALGQEIQKP